MDNKRGQGMSTNTIILLVLGVIILVVLILGFTTGWDRIAPWISKSNVDTIATTCEAACGTASTYDYCNAERKLVDAEKNKYSASCTVFANVEEFSKYGIKDCSIDCLKDCEDIVIDGKHGSTEAIEGYDVSALANQEFCVIPFE